MRLYLNKQAPYRTGSPAERTPLLPSSAHSLAEPRPCICLCARGRSNAAKVLFHLTKHRWKALVFIRPWLDLVAPYISDFLFCRKILKLTTARLPTPRFPFSLTSSFLPPRIASKPPPNVTVTSALRFQWPSEAASYLIAMLHYTVFPKLAYGFESLGSKQFWHDWPYLSWHSEGSLLDLPCLHRLSSCFHSFKVRLFREKIQLVWILQDKISTQLTFL